jgi:GNAT superfamily N-acetyltransferase
VVGLVSLICEEQEAEVEPLIVASRHRGRGIGMELLSHAIARAKAMGVQYVSVRAVQHRAGVGGI